MAKIARWLAHEMLTKSNPDRADLVQLYLDQFMAYLDANDHLAEQPAVVADPKTKELVQNPYLLVRQSARRAMLEMRQVKGTGRLWAAIEASAAASARSTPRAGSARSRPSG